VSFFDKDGSFGNKIGTSALVLLSLEHKKKEKKKRKNNSASNENSICLRPDNGWFSCMTLPIVQGCWETDLRWVKALSHDTDLVTTWLGTLRVTKGEGGRAQRETPGIGLSHGSNLEAAKSSIQDKLDDFDILTPYGDFQVSGSYGYTIWSFAKCQIHTFLDPSNPLWCD
jgi:hypothetical protein